MKLAIFDFDDTLIHLDISWADVKKDVITLSAKKGIKEDPAEHLIPMSNRLSLDPDMKKAIDAIFLRYEGKCITSKKYTIFSEMMSLVKDLKGKGFLLAIVSGNLTSSIKAILSRAGMTGYFDVICGRDILSKNKPNPDQILFVLDNLKVSKKEALYAGDSVFDELTAKAAGVGFVKVAHGDGIAISEIRKAFGL